MKVEDIRTLLASAAMQGFNGGQRAFVFVNAQLMSTQIQNTLLKTLEEPHSETMLILTGNEFGLLPTIRSRCMIERIGAGDVQKAAQSLSHDGIEKQDALFFAGLADGIESRARAYATEEAQAFRAEDRPAAYVGARGVLFQVAEMNGEVVGFIDREGDFVHALHVRAAHARQGVGWRLMDHAEAQIARAGFVSARLETDTFNRRSRAFYAKRGYREAERYPDEQWDSDLTTILLVKQLP